MTDSHQQEHLQEQQYSDWQQLRKWLLLSFQPGVGPVRFNSLLKEFGSVDAVFSASYTQLKQGIPEKLADKIAGNPETPEITSWIENTRNWLEASNAHHILSLHSSLYPARLRELNDAPPLLYVIGNPNLLNEPQLAIVGSRRPTPAAMRLAQELATELSRAGLVITSGMAQGIDTAAHQGTLGGYGSTVAVLGTGVDRIYPQSNQSLYGAIAQQGALISEFPLGTAPTPNNFPKRNRIISGLSLGVLVVEASVKSGSLISARLAAEQGREVFAVPGSVLNPMSKGCHKLIREGAVLVETSKDVLLELQPLLEPLLAEEEKVELYPEFSGAQRIVLEAIGFDPVSTDSLSEVTGLSWEELSVILTEMELDSVIVSVPGGFIRSKK